MPVSTKSHSSDERADVITPIATRSHNSNDVFCPLLLSYYYNDESVAHSHNDLRPVAIVAIRSSVGTFHI
jgi:hypothetical protein